MMSKTSVYIIQAKKYGVHRHYDGSTEVVPVGIDAKVVTPIGHNERPFGRFLKTVCKKNLVKSCTNKEFFIFLKTY